MPTPTRTVSRRTMVPHRGRRLVLEVPPFCDVVSVREAGRRTRYDVSLAAIFDLAVRQHVTAWKASKKRRAK